MRIRELNRNLLFLSMSALIGAACEPAGSKPAPATASPTPVSSSGLDTTPVPAAAAADEPAPEATPLPAGLAPFTKPWKGDFDGMVKRRIIRVLAVQNPVLYAVDKGREVGITYETVRAFENAINLKLGNKTVKVYVILLPVPRNELLSRLEKGEGDIAAAALTVTPERKRRVDFSQPFASGITEILITSPGSKTLAGLDDLSGQKVYVRPSSSYAEHLRTLNQRFGKERKPLVEIMPAPEVLEDGDILEMVNAGLVPATVVNTYIADLYLQVFPGLVKQTSVQSKPQEIAWAFRKQSPKLAAAVNDFVKEHAKGSKEGNYLITKYLKNTQWVKNARSDEDRQKFQTMVALFQKYSRQYAVDYLLMAAQGYQESGLDQSKRSHVGAIGVMQVMPKTARDKVVNIPDIEKLESNIHAGIKYNRWMIDHYYQSPKISPLDKELFAFASYNAGPAKVASLRKQATAAGLNPNKWFNNVELIAAKRIGRETVTYVSNIYKYYLAYQLMAQLQENRQAARSAVSKKQTAGKKAPPPRAKKPKAG